jgi:hypothetical protein
MAKKPKKSASTPKRDVGLADETTEQRIARLEREGAKLKREIESLRTDCEILKRAEAFFEKERK